MHRVLAVVFAEAVPDDALRIELGSCINAARHRVLAHAASDFSSALASDYFYATFECAAAHATGVSAATRCTESTYTLAPLDHVCRTDVDRADAWYQCKVRASRMYTRTGRWFDVRATCVCETRVHVPLVIKQARTRAANTRNEWAFPDTRAATPEVLRHCITRTLTFAAAPSWRVEFTCANTTRLATSVVFDPSVNAKTTRTELMPDRTDVYKIALVRAPGAAPSVAEACATLDVLATVIAPDTASIRARLDADRERYERTHWDSPYHWT